MGLGITAYEHIVPVSNDDIKEAWNEFRDVNEDENAVFDPFCDDYGDFEYEAGYFRPFAYVGHEATTRGFLDHDQRGTLYGHEFIACNHWYRKFGKEHKWAFSYGGYARFRESLSDFAHGVTPDEVWEDLDKYRDLPFYEIIHFADNEGYVGPEAATDLYNDFVENHDGYTEYLENRETDLFTRDWFAVGYQNFITGLELAQFDGTVHYH